MSAKTITVKLTIREACGLASAATQGLVTNEVVDRDHPSYAHRVATNKAINRIQLAVAKAQKPRRRK